MAKSRSNLGETWREIEQRGSGVIGNWKTWIEGFVGGCGSWRSGKKLGDFWELEAGRFNGGSVY